MREYYSRRAPEYDDWYLGTGGFADRDRPGWHEELAELTKTISLLPPARTLDVACGTGFLTRHLPGDLTGLDQSAEMLAIARARAPEGMFVQGDALTLPFADGAFDRVFTGSFYGHLDGRDRVRFVAEARRVARELVVVDAAERPEVESERVEERRLADGSRWEIYKRRFTPAGLAAELGGGRAVFDGRWFVAVRA